MPDPVRLGVLGCDNVGAALVALVHDRRAEVRARTGIDLEVARVAVRDPTKPRAVDLPPDAFTDDAAALVHDPEVDLVVELIGGVEPARTLVLDALQASKPVVTANKELLAEVGAELFGAADAASVDLLFEAAGRRGIPTICVGDGGNELGMGLIPEAVRVVPYGAQCQCGCGSGIGARTACDLLLPAACSNWGCYAAVAALAVQLKDPGLLHTPAQEELLLRTGVAAGLLNSPRGTVDPNADNIPLSSHLAIVELLREAALRAIQST